MLDSVPIPIISVTASGIIEVFNSGATRMFGYGPEEAIGQHMELLLPGCKGDGKKAWREIIGSNDEIIARRKNGPEFPVVVTSAEGSATDSSGLTCVVRDNSERKATENALQKAIYRVRAILETIPNAIVTTDAEGFIEGFNLASEPMFQYTAEEVIGKNIGMLLPEIGEASGASVDTAPIRLAIGQESETLARRKDGSRFPIELAVGGISIEGQGLVACVIQDISARKRAEEQARAARDQLIQTEKLASLGQLVAGVAHEINTPVGIAVTAASHLAEQTGEIAADYRSGNLKRSSLERYLEQATEVARILMTNLTRASELIQSFKQVAVDQSSAERRTFPLKAYIEEVMLSLRPQIKKTAHRLSLVCDDEVVIDSFPGAISQILANLVVNSLTHAFEPEQAGKMLLSIRVHEKLVELKYSDDGKGIPEDALKRIFDPFFTTARGTGGSGLGLHIVHNLVVQTLGGKITCTSQCTEGTLFTIKFPLKGPEPQ